MKDDHLTLEQRIAEALQRIKLGHGQMRIPAEATDPDLVLFDCRKRIEQLEVLLGMTQAEAATLRKALLATEHGSCDGCQNMELPYCAVCKEPKFEDTDDDGVMKLRPHKPGCIVGQAVAMPVSPTG